MQIIHDSVSYGSIGTTQLLYSLSFKSRLMSCRLNIDLLCLFITEPARTILHLICVT